MICRDAGRDPSIIVVVEDVSDLWALERAGAVRARYHVLGGVLSALDGCGRRISTSSRSSSAPRSRRSRRSSSR